VKRRKTVFVCQQCGYQHPRWVGKCPNCGEWNSLVETTVSPKVKSQKSKVKTAKPQRLSEINQAYLKRIPTRMGEVDRVLGGGLVSGSVILVAGEPGIGKSTLLLQLAAKVAGGTWQIVDGKKPTTHNPQPISVLYVSGEESAEQIKLRADRLGFSTDNLFLLSETDVEAVIDQIEKLTLNNQPLITIVDSIQTMQAFELSQAPGSIGQVRECAYRLHHLAKEKRFCLFLVGHVTKGGIIAGPKVLEHLVDTVLYLEGQRFSAFRLLRSMKNRFGPTDEVGVFEMGGKGMKEVTNPSELFVSRQDPCAPGSVVVATMEGNRPLLVEIQALVVSSHLSVPRRVSSGISTQRLILLCAVLQKSLNLPLGTSDVYINVAGGLSIFEPAADLGVCLSLVSSFKNKPLDSKIAVFGEVGLLGEIRTVPFADKRKKEAQKLGFVKIVSPEEVKSIKEALKVAKIV
jgi:DNA repair protein RadA/Sms